jgi:hypothetical protein
VVEYVTYVYDITKIHGNSKSTTKPHLPKEIPIFRPRFVPPTYLHIKQHEPNTILSPSTAYLKPFNVIHPFYYDNIGRCPQCSSTDVRWNAWTPTGHREVHGLREEETALGYQMICKHCEQEYSHSKKKPANNGGDGSFYFATTNPLFWKNWEHWAIPC